MAPAKKTLPKKVANVGPKQHIKAVLVEKGFKFTNTTMKLEFVIGKEIGCGGFGRIYEAQQIGSTNTTVALKMEPHSNGPLFTEIHLYQKILKEQQLLQWKKNNNLNFLGLPYYITSGKTVYENEELRYLVIPKYNDSVEAALERSKTCFSLRQVVNIAKCVLNAYYYLHSQKYVHADVKAGNLLMETKDDFEHVVLIDFGMTRKLPDVLIEKEDKKNAHNGTIEFTSCDAHRGCLPSCRGDLEILCHNMLYWITGSLPWEDEKNLTKVYAQKKEFIDNAEEELVELIESKKALSVIRFMYKTYRKMAYADPIDIPGILKLLMKV